MPLLSCLLLEQLSTTSSLVRHASRQLPLCLLAESELLPWWSLVLWITMSHSSWEELRPSFGSCSKAERKLSNSSLAQFSGKVMH